MPLAEHADAYSTSDAALSGCSERGKSLPSSWRASVRRIERHPMKRDYLSIVEAAYALRTDEKTWLQGITDAAAPVVDDGFGVCANTFDASDPGNVAFGAGATAGGMTREELLAGQRRARAPLFQPCGNTSAKARASASSMPRLTSRAAKRRRKLPSPLRAPRTS